MTDQKIHKIHIGTRASPLARIQAQIVVRAFANFAPPEKGSEKDAAKNFEIVALTTKGDQIVDRHLRDLGGKDLFIRDIEVALLSGRIDLAVHSLKDMPAVQPEGLTIAAILPRSDPRDALVTKNSFRHLCDLPAAARIGTASPRRHAQIKFICPNLNPVLLRGNVDTRLKKIAAGELDAALLSMSGLERLGHAQMACALEPNEILPAAAQGALCVEARRDDDTMLALCATIHDAATEKIVTAERSFSASFGASCNVPVAALAQLDGEDILLRTQLLSPDGAQSFFDARQGSCDEAAALGRAAAQHIAQQAGADFLRKIGIEMK